MTQEMLSLALNGIDAKYIEEATMMEKRHTSVFSFRRIAVLAAALLLLLFCSVSALAAADVQPAYELLYTVSPSLAQKLKPICLADEDQGIRMEVVSASVEGDTALIYISMKDLEGDRIDATTDLFDSHSINRPFDCSATCRIEGYDAEAKTAYFLLKLTQWHGQDISGRKITFSVREFLSRKQEFVGEISGVELSRAETVTETQSSWQPRGSSLNVDSVPVQILVPDRGITPVSGANITALGFVDGKLHVQVYYEDVLHTDNHGSVWLQDENGNTVDCEGALSFWDEENCGSYEEYIFPVSSAETLKDYSLWGDFTVCGSHTEGNWQVTFPLET